MSKVNVRNMKKKKDESEEQWAERGGVRFSFDYDFGANLDEMTKLFGDESVYNSALADMKVQANDFARPLIKEGKSFAEVQKELDGWKPGVRMSRKLSQVEKARRIIDALSDEEKIALGIPVKKAKK